MEDELCRAIGSRVHDKDKAELLLAMYEYFMLDDRRSLVSLTSPTLQLARSRLAEPGKGSMTRCDTEHVYTASDMRNTG